MVGGARGSAPRRFGGLSEVLTLSSQRPRGPPSPSLVWELQAGSQCGAGCRVELETQRAETLFVGDRPRTAGGTRVRSDAPSGPPCLSALQPA